MQYRQIDYVIEGCLQIDAARTGEDAEGLPLRSREYAASLLKLRKGNFVALACWLDEQLDAAGSGDAAGSEDAAGSGASAVG